MQIILASNSAIRKTLLAQAGVEFTTQASRVDEETIKASLLAEGAKPREVADALAEYKALRVAGRSPHDLVIGCDQVLECEGVLYDKASDLDAARAKLVALRGKPHNLLSAAVIYEGGKPVWRTVGRAQLFMRDFSDEFLDAYLTRNGEKILQSVGCYLLEEEGVQLFTRIQGDYFTVLGFPLLEVVEFLRTKGLVSK
jgi:septum formation protein